MSQVTKYHISGPCGQHDTANDVEDALKKASRMVYMPLLQAGAYRKRLQAGKFVDWAYGFDVVRIDPVVEVGAV